MAIFTLKFMLISAAIFIYYYLLVSRLGPVSRPLAEMLGLGKRYPVRDISAVVNLPVAALAQFLFSLVLIAITGVSVGPLLIGEFQPILMLYGILLGIGEMALATFLCLVAIQIAMKVAPAGSAPQNQNWSVIARGGWMRYHMKTLEVAPMPLATLSILLYVGVEEMIFRPILITYFLPQGAGVALICSVFFYVLVQVFHMPDWRAAMFPIIGALVIGIFHGLLFLAVPSLLPLVIAHFVFFIAAVLS